MVWELSADILSSTVAQGSLAVAGCDGDGVTAAARFMMCSSRSVCGKCSLCGGVVGSYQARVCHARQGMKTFTYASSTHASGAHASGTRASGTLFVHRGCTSLAKASPLRETRVPPCVPIDLRVFCTAACSSTVSILRNAWPRADRSGWSLRFQRWAKGAMKGARQAKRMEMLWWIHNFFRHGLHVLDSCSSLRAVARGASEREDNGKITSARPRRCRRKMRASEPSWRHARARQKCRRWHTQPPRQARRALQRRGGLSTRRHRHQIRGGL